MTDNAPLTVEDYRALARFRHALREFLRFSEDAAGAAGLSPAQHQLLLAIAGHPGPDEPTVGDLANALLLKPHSAGELIARAVANGFVERRDDPADHRRTLLSLTDQGDAVLAELSVLHRDELRRFRRDLDDLLEGIGPGGTDAAGRPDA